MSNISGALFAPRRSIFRDVNPGARAPIRTSWRKPPRSLDAIVLAVDEKPLIQALERAQGYLKLPNRRHGTTTLFAALDVATGKVIGRHTKRRRFVEFLAFMNEVVAAYLDCPVHVVLDNLSTHKPKHDGWLARHKNVSFHYTPTHTSWLNQIEIWFSILAGRSLKGASFKGLEELKAHIDRTHNKTAWPFVWTKSEVHQKRPWHSGRSQPPSVVLLKSSICAASAFSASVASTC